MIHSVSNSPGTMLDDDNNKESVYESNQKLQREESASKFCGVEEVNRKLYFDDGDSNKPTSYKCSNSRENIDSSEKIILNTGQLYPSQQKELPSTPTPRNERIYARDSQEIQQLKSAAASALLPDDELSDLEVKCFPDLNQCSPLKKEQYLYLRNRLLYLWMNNPSQELVLENALEEIKCSNKEQRLLVVTIHAFLERQGKINFGVFNRLKSLPLLKQAKIIVIGAGVSGLAAARQLEHFGMEVVILEGRNRVGGRVHTFKKPPFYADLGGMILTGVVGNPLTFLIQQLGMETNVINQDCPLYDSTGRRISKNKDAVIDREYNRLLDATKYLSEEMNCEHFDGKIESLEDSLKILLTLQEKKVREDNIKYLETIIYLQEELKSNQQEMCSLMEKIKKLRQDYDVSRQTSDRSDITEEFVVRTKGLDLSTACKKWDKLKKCQEEIEKELHELEGSPPFWVYMHERDRRILDWFLANLEFCTAAQLSELSCDHWNQDDPYELAGSHVAATQGLSQIPEALSSGLNTRLNTVVRMIQYGYDGVKVTATSSKTSDGLEIHKGDAVLCTLPLGVMKRSVSEELGPPDERDNRPMFNPPLPTWKVGAIKRLGFGVMNKVVLCFTSVFWDPEDNWFGHVENAEINRGECFMFGHFSKAPVLVAFVSGYAAIVLEQVSDDVIVNRCLSVLRKIFGKKAVTPLKDKMVTRWGADPWSRGSYSHVAVGSSGADYDLLAAPVAPPPEYGLNTTRRSRLFFAGEHTTRKYPASVHGAYLSGVREAARIAEDFLGRPITPSRARGRLSRNRACCDN
uniref:Lysine-specific histone demethylase n=1 Tax=Timema poppense TaxID=170557 RepID=A0A7R9CI09_TIMPO|nr:unnamed protein product [Timema poppensis]